MLTIDGRVFVTVLGEDDTPARLVTISDFVSPDSGPLLQPYPGWSWHKPEDCDGITNVYRIAVCLIESFFI